MCAMIFFISSGSEKLFPMWLGFKSLIVASMEKEFKNES